ncbi:hypothetical protein ALC60_09135 [Trachymyrmex zeteki]|uniref:Uncharacterized protein n=1 Tax=Mycetomoellerius zeteki TaxID=64791 RepID=A0A151WV81_9HYME|nr:hypothetical protein ALC60_09135 [Trachymyrmex zeteki]
MLVYAVRQKVRRRFMAGKTVWLFGANATTRFITAACRFGSNKTIVAHCVSKNGLSNEWESNPCVQFVRITVHGLNNISRQLKTRLHEHVSDINKKSKSPTVITSHRIDQNHNFDWGNVEILDRETSFNKRLISEMVHIKRQTHGLNK